MNKIAIIGAGNMGRAIADGILRKRIVPAKSLTLSDISRQAARTYQSTGVTVTADNVRAIAHADAIVLAVKPHCIRDVLEEIQPVLADQQLIISVAAGITVPSIQKNLAAPHPIIRVMPNLCAQVGGSMSVWTRNKQVTVRQVRIARAILGAIGSEYELHREQDIDRCTAISGSGPAYVFYLVDVLAHAARDLGLPPSLAQTLARETIIGSGMVLQESSASPRQLRDAVTSKGGTTEAALAIMTKSDIAQVMKKAARAAYKKARTLGSQREK